VNNAIAYKLAQLPRNALFVGLDPHKREHAIVVMNDKARVVAKIDNDRWRFETLLDRCEHLRRRHGAATYLFAIEPGAHYWRKHVLQTEGVDPHRRKIVRILGVGVTCALSLQAKGKIERAYRWQDRIAHTCAGDSQQHSDRCW